MKKSVADSEKPVKAKEFDKELFKRSVEYNVRTLYRKNLEEADAQQIFQAVSYAIKDRIVENWMETQKAYEKEDPKMVYYMSMEFLMGRALGNNLINLKAYKPVAEALEELGLDIPVCGKVKDDNHRTRGLYFHNVEIPIDRHGEGFKLITRIQDEAHRFAIEYHRSLRSKAQVHSILDDIEGIGPARRKALMRRFQSMENMKNASVEELAETDSMNLAAAQNVYDTLHSGPA